MMDQSFAELVPAAQAGDQAARELLFSRAVRLVYARAYRAVRDFDVAGDIAQEALIKAAVGLPRLRRPGSFLSWLRAIVDRTVAAHRRQAARSELQLPAASEVFQAEPAAAQAALARVEAEEVRRALAALPPKTRLMVELFYFEGMTCAEVGEFLHVSREAVKSTLRRSRERLRRSVRSVTVAANRPATIKGSMVSGDHPPGGPLFAHESDIARFYLALYPRGLVPKATTEANVAGERAQEILGFLEERRLIVQENGLWRCTVPVISDVDVEVLRPWAQTTAAVVIDRLDDLYAHAAEMARLVQGEKAQQTVLAAALFADAETCPTQAIYEAMQLAAPDRGRHGKYLAAFRTADSFPCGFNGHIKTDEDETPYGFFRYCYLHPVGTDRSGIAEFVRRFDPTGASQEPHPVPSNSLFQLLFSLAASPANEDEAASRLAEFGLLADEPHAFLRELERLQAIRRVGEELQSALPLLPIAPWAEYAGSLTELGEQVTEALGDNADELRSRIMRCSFAQCNLADAVAACVMFLRGLIGDEIHRRGWVQIPPQADFSWGCLLFR